MMTAAQLELLRKQWIAENMPLVKKIAFAVNALGRPVIINGWHMKLIEVGGYKFLYHTREDGWNTREERFNRIHTVIVSEGKGHWYQPDSKILCLVAYGDIEMARNQRFIPGDWTDTIQPYIKEADAMEISRKQAREEKEYNRLAGLLFPYGIPIDMRVVQEVTND